MSKNRKNNSAGKINAAAQALMLQKRFIERIELLCNTLVGPGYFEKLPHQMLIQMYAVRYPVLKIKAAPGTGISKTTIVKANKLLIALMENQYIDLYNGNRILFRILLSEGLLLINFLYAIPDHYFPHSDEIKEEFKDYFPGTEAYESIGLMLETMVQDVIVFLSDLNQSIIKADCDETACFDIQSDTNDILLYEFKTDKTAMVIEDKRREMFRLGWIDGDMKWVWTNVKPSSLGFKITGLDIPLDVYVQKHALDKLQERIDITPGIMHSLIFLTFSEKVIKHYKEFDHSLVEFAISDKKVGYLLVKIHQSRLVIHTFLFLTNNGTPEGRKLEKLVSLQQADKEYLDIDKLSTFNSYHFNKNEKLRNMFIEAGCGSLLDLEHLQEFSINKVKDKDPESILRYLADAMYFNKYLPTIAPES